MNISLLSESILSRIKTLQTFSSCVLQINKTQTKHKKGELLDHLTLKLSLNLSLISLLTQVQSER